MSDDIIKKALGMSLDSPKEDNPVVPYKEEISHIDDELENDIKFAHDNIIELIAQGSEAISELMLIAKQSQHPRAFEVIANLLKTTSDLNNDLVNLHKKRVDINPKSTKNDSRPTTQNNLFVGSTAELQKFLADMNKKNNE